MLEELMAEVRKHDRAEVAYKSGVSIATLEGLLSGRNKNPKLSTMQALRGFLDQKEKEAGK